MKKAVSPARAKVELGRYIVADPAICHGQVTFRGTRVFVADVLADVERGLSWDSITARWGGGKIGKAAIAEAVHLARTAFLSDDGRLAPRPRAARLARVA
jgi:uncharacterized protein (DUF433 family)